jgi:hypothetical protein
MISSAVTVRVEAANALLRPSRLLIVKYAQFSYGVDAKIAERIGVARRDLPAPGSFFAVRSDGTVAAESVVFIGTPGIEDFGYGAVREFGRQAVRAAAEVAPGVPEICVTVNGPGFGLDETESFAAQVGGIADAVSAGEAAPRLRAVTFLERDQSRADRMQRTLADILPAHRVDRSPAAVRLGSAGVDSEARGHAFVAMPFDHSFDDTFHYGIAPAVRSSGVLCERLDQQAFTGDVVQRMLHRIADAKFIVADVTGANPNVYLELGIAWGREVPAILLCREPADLRFDIRNHRCLLYGSIRDLEAKLAQEIAELFASPATMRG